MELLASGVNPARSMDMLRAIQAGEYDQAEGIRKEFCDLENLRNDINPIRVLHRAVELAEIANTGPMLPLLSELDAGQVTAVAAAAVALRGVAA